MFETGDWVEGVQTPDGPRWLLLALSHPPSLLSDVGLLVWGVLEGEHGELESGTDWVWESVFFPLKFSKTQEPYVGFQRFLVLFFSFWLPEEELFLEQGRWWGGSGCNQCPPANTPAADRQGAGTGSAQDGSRASRHDVTSWWTGWLFWRSRRGLVGCRVWVVEPRPREERPSWEGESCKTGWDTRSGVRLLEAWSEGRMTLLPSSSVAGAYSTGRGVLITSGS